MPKGIPLTYEDVADSTTQKHGMRRTAMEAEALGDPAKIGEFTPADPGVVKWKNGVAVRPGKRPLLNVGKRNAFAAGMTERQRRRGKVRTARSWGRMLAVLEETGMTMEEFVQGLSPEELVQGKLKDKDGTFRGAPPAWVPRQFHRACIKELMRRGKHLWQGSYLESITALTEIAKGNVKGAKVADRLKAAQLVIERIEGKTPEVLVLTEEAPWQLVIDDIVALVPDEQIQAARKARDQFIPDSEVIIDAELVEEPSPSPSPRRRAAASRRKR